jgi:3-(3-hydroxy-phenyl)propionate hydroxylase
VSSKGLRIMRAEDWSMRLRREIAARVAPTMLPAGAWLANGPLQITLPRPGSPTSSIYY